MATRSVSGGAASKRGQACTGTTSVPPAAEIHDGGTEPEPVGSAVVSYQGRHRRPERRATRGPLAKPRTSS
jgi:hypothetical protein